MARPKSEDRRLALLSAATSSCGAIYYGHAPQTAAFDETIWTKLDGQGEISTYVKSKVLAERAAWDFAALR